MVYISRGDRLRNIIWYASSGCGTLNLELRPDGTLALTWPAPSDCSPESITNTLQHLGWQSVAGPYDAIGGRHVLALTPTNGAGFFRLHGVR